MDEEGHMYSKQRLLVYRGWFELVFESRFLFYFYQATSYCVYSVEAILISTPTYLYFIEDRKDIPKLSPFASWPGAMMNPQWLELPMSRKNSMVAKLFETLTFDCMCKGKYVTSAFIAHQHGVPIDSRFRYLKPAESRRQFALNVKACFLGKIRKKKSNCRLLN